MSGMPEFIRKQEWMIPGKYNAIIVIDYRMPLTAALIELGHPKAKHLITLFQNVIKNDPPSIVVQQMNEITKITLEILTENLEWRDRVLKCCKKMLDSHADLLKKHADIIGMEIDCIYIQPRTSEDRDKLNEARYFIPQVPKPHAVTIGGFFRHLISEGSRVYCGNMMENPSGKEMRHLTSMGTLEQIRKNKIRLAAFSEGICDLGCNCKNQPNSNSKAHIKLDTEMCAQTDVDQILNL
jgi:hypothetical protein